MSSLPISEIIKQGNKTSAEPTPLDEEPQVKRSRSEAYKKAKELEEARKAGDAPALQDEDGRDINPHIPQYISSVPFFYNTAHPTLKHQRSLKPGQKHVPIDLQLQRGVKIQNATKYRPGACENCGAMTHKRKDCLERPRKVGAKFTNKHIAPDEVIVPEIEHTFDSKRDRWAGYHPDMHKQYVEEFEKIEEAKRKLKEENLRKEANAAKQDDDDDDDDNNDKDNDDANQQKASTSKARTSKEVGDVDLSDSLDSDSDEDEEKYAEKADMPGTKVDKKQRQTVRNLRLREDTAKYLLNLDPESAYYDPKTRSMRENPLPETSGKKLSAAATAHFPGENFIRYSGDVNKVNKAQVFAWQAADKGIDIHLQALPTKAEMVQKEYEIKKNEYNEHIAKFITHKYGDPDKQARPAKDLQLEQSERYVEFSRTGRIVKGNPGSSSNR